MGLSGHSCGGGLRHRYATLVCGALVIGAVPAAHGASGRLLATGGVTEFEGSGGGGLTPWALITGLGTNSQIGASADCPYIRPQHFSLTSCGAGLGIDNRVEFSYA